MRMAGPQECATKNNLKPHGKGRSPGCYHVPCWRDAPKLEVTQVRPGCLKANTWKLSASKRWEERLSLWRKEQKEKLRILSPGHLEEEFKGLKYKSELLVMNDVVVSTDGWEWAGERDRVRDFTSSEVVGSCHMSYENTHATGFRQLERWGQEWGRE